MGQLRKKIALKYQLFIPQFFSKNVVQATNEKAMGYFVSQLLATTNSSYWPEQSSYWLHLGLFWAPSCPIAG